MTFVRLLAVALSATILAACTGGGDGFAVSTDQKGILGGTETSVGDYPTVVAVVIDGGRHGLCTGTLIAPDVVLTAAHCVSPDELGYASQDEVTANVVVAFDSVDLQTQQPGKVIKARYTRPIPGFQQPGDRDVGIVLLAQPVTDRTPSPININPADAPVGIHVTMVGYGMSKVGDMTSAGTEYVLNDKVSTKCDREQVSDRFFLCYSQTDGTGKCSGDSGGPSFAMINGVQTVVGVTSFGDQNCEQFGVDMRVDATLDFIGKYEPDLVCQGDGYCNEDCGVGDYPVDSDCATCATNDDCDASHPLCAGGVCLAGQEQDGGLGAICTTGNECDTTQCASGPGGDSRCILTCDPSADQSGCPDGFTCLEADDSGACWPSDQVGGGGCSATGGEGPGGMALSAAGLVLLIGLGGLRRRRRQARVG